MSGKRFPKFTVSLQEYIGCVVDWEDVIRLPNSLRVIVEAWRDKGWEFSHVSTVYDGDGPSFYAEGYRPMTEKERKKEEDRLAKKTERKKQSSLEAKQKREEEKAKTEAEELELLKKLKAKYEK